jgi:hypothetical protein
MNPDRATHASNRCVARSIIRSRKMNRYDPRTPRTLIGFAAVAMAAATLAIAVLAPAGMDYVTKDIDVLTQVEDTTCTADGVITSMNVVAVRSAHAVPVVQSRASQAHYRISGTVDATS